MFHLSDTLAHYPLVLIPIVAVCVTSIVSWVATIVMFYPLRPIGLFPFLGLQGIIPAHGQKIARKVTEASLGKIGTPHEIFLQLDPELMKNHFIRSLKPWIPVYTRDVLFETYPRLSKLLPNLAKDLIASQVNARLPSIVEAIIQDLIANIDEVLDIEWMAQRELYRRPELLVRIFRECGRKEIPFIIKGSVVVGLVMGLLQAGAWYLYPSVWLLAAIGLIVGGLGAKLVLTTIFSPTHPTRIGPLVLQGIFPRRQDEIARTFCHLVTDEILTLPNIAYALLHGPGGPQVRELIADKLNATIDETIRGTEDIVKIIQRGGIDLGIERIKLSMADKVVGAFREPFQDEAFASSRQQIVEDLLTESMRAVPAEEFQALLRPSFQEHEYKLALAMALVAGIAGLVQGGVYLVLG